MNSPLQLIHCLACSIFRREIEELQRQGKLAIRTEYLDSMLHMTPENLNLRLNKALEGPRGGEQRVILVYGDCCAHMADFQAMQGVVRTEGINCCEILLGTEAYQRMRKEGAFFLLPEWAMEWKKIFEFQLGLTGAVAQDFMREMHTKLIYLDTGLRPVPHDNLEAASAFTGLPLEILPVPLEPLLESLHCALDKAVGHE